MDESQDALDLLKGRHLLIVDDGFLAAEKVCATLRGMGTVLIPPALSIGAAMAVLDQQQVDGAILDIRLDEATVFPLVERLQALAVPFVFAIAPPPFDSGDAYGGYVLCERPSELAEIARALFDPARAGH